MYKTAPLVTSELGYPNQISPPSTLIEEVKHSLCFSVKKYRNHEWMTKVMLCVLLASNFCFSKTK